jgi:Tol biopolymer transport system component
MRLNLLSALTISASAQSVLAQGQCVTTQISRTPGGDNSSGDSGWAAISADGRYVAFASTSDNIVAGDTNGVSDVFVQDRLSGITMRVSSSSNGTQADGPSSVPAVSSDGRYVAFQSAATNLVPNDTNGKLDVFVRDRVTGTTTRASVADDGSEGDDDSFSPSVSGDGRLVAFLSLAGNLTPSDTNHLSDVFVRDLASDLTTRVSVSSTGTEGNGECGGVSYFQRGPALSLDGRFVAFQSFSDNLIPGDTNNHWDVFVHDLVTGTTVCASVTSAGALGDGDSYNPTISGDGVLVAFESFAMNLGAGHGPEIMLRDSQSGSTTKVSVNMNGGYANADSNDPALSADGHFIVFESNASDLVPQDTNGHGDIFVRDLQAGATTRVSVASDGTQGDSWSAYPSGSSDASSVVFVSDSTTFNSLGHSGANNVFVRACGTFSPAALCDSKVNSQGCTPHITFVGTPSTTATNPFIVGARSVINNRFGVLIYGVYASNTPFRGGHLCAGPPFRRTSIQNSGGHPPPADCSGVFAMDFNQLIRAGSDPHLYAGQVVYAQYWYRDPADPAGFSCGLTDAVRFTILP